ncbi:MAG: sigma-70 family RNA polymerase sigma factor [Pseudomonadota bacterium]
MSHDAWMTVQTNPLPPAEQDRLIRELRRTGDPAIERRLVESNVRLVLKIARQLDRTHGHAFDDLVQEGCLGLIEAIHRYDPAKGARLSTYAAFWIRACIMKYAMDNVRIVRAVRTRAERAAFFKGVVGSAEVPLDAKRGPSETAVGDVIADAAAPADRRLEIAELAWRVRRSADALAPRLPGGHAAVLRDRLLADEPVPRQRVARRMSLSGERVRQIELELQSMIRLELVAAAA